MLIKAELNFEQPGNGSTSKHFLLPLLNIATAGTGLDAWHQNYRGFLSDTLGDCRGQVEK